MEQVPGACLISASIEQIKCLGLFFVYSLEHLEDKTKKANLQSWQWHYHGTMNLSISATTV
jgi:hypothetical protein